MAYQGVAELRHSRELKLAKQQGRQSSSVEPASCSASIIRRLLYYGIPPKAAWPASIPDITDVSGAKQCWSAIQLGKVPASVLCSEWLSSIAHGVQSTVTG